MRCKQCGCGSPDRPGATPLRTLSDYFTADSPLARECAHALSDSSVLRVLAFTSWSARRECGFTRVFRKSRNRKGARDCHPGVIGRFAFSCLYNGKFISWVFSLNYQKRKASVLCASIKEQLYYYII